MAPLLSGWRSADFEWVEGLDSQRCEVADVPGHDDQVVNDRRGGNDASASRSSERGDTRIPTPVPEVSADANGGVGGPGSRRAASLREATP